MESSKINNITKEAAKIWLKDNRNRFDPGYNAKRIFEVTVLGDDYDDYDIGMSYLCRAYSITQYGKRNRIKNVYRKYLGQYSEEELRSSIEMIVRNNPNGIDEEDPTFEQRLLELLQRNSLSQARIYERQDYLQDQNNNGAKISSNMNASFRANSKAVPMFIGAVLLLLGIWAVSRNVHGGIIYNIFWMMELLGFYGGIIYCIVVLVQKKPKRKLLLGVSSIIAGLGFGSLKGGELVWGLIYLIVAGVISAYYFKRMK